MPRTTPTREMLNAMVAEATSVEAEKMSTTAAPSTAAPAPWLMTVAEFNAARARLLLAGEAACSYIVIDSATARAQRLKVELETGKAKKAADAVWNAPAGFGAGDLVAKSKAANLRLSKAKDALAETESAYSKQWNARQEGYVAYAKERLVAWIDHGAVVLHPFERGSPLLTVCSHEDVVRVAIAAGHPVPDIVLDDYPALSSVRAGVVDRPRGG